MPDLRQIGQTSNTVRFKLTKSTDGTAFTGLTSASSGLIISTICDNEATATAYTQAGSTIETITTLGTFATPTTNKCRFKEIDSTNHPGLYEFQFANARFAVSNARRMIISVSGVSNLFSSDYEIEFTSTDLNITSLAIADTQDSQGITLAAIQAMTDDMPHYFGLIARADAGIATDHAAILALINENGGSGGGTYDNTTDSQEALRNNLALASTALSTATWTGTLAANLTTLAGHDPGETIMGATDLGTGAGLTSLATQASVNALPQTITVKKNSALSGFPFVMVSSSNHVTPTAGLTVTATRSIDGAAFAACANAVAEVASGAYNINLAASDLNGDTILLRFTATGADDVFVTIVTQP